MREQMTDSIVFLLVCVLFVLFPQFIFSASSIPLDGFFIDCGGSNNPTKLDDSRVFRPDSSFSDVKLSPSSDIVVSVVELSSSSSPTVYDSARVFTRTSAYTVKTRHTGHHWLRLHFSPIQNSHYDLKSAVFSVLANGFTLLHGFSFSKSGKDSSLVKEYVIEVGGSSSKHLVLTLSPWNGSVAFINGIEVISMPKDFLPSSIVPIPLGPEVEISSHVAFETVYRVNMGGPVLTAKNDSLWRTWEPDHPYLLSPATARSAVVNPNSIKYPPGVTVETAPNWVYATAQEMADANVSEQRFNISWAFEVEEGFSYLIRLHFCDIVGVVLNNLVFNVYINTHSSLTSFDISSKTMALSSAYYADFLTPVSKGSNRILVQVGPPNFRNLPSNAILNGLEILKMSNPSQSLDEDLQVFYNGSKTSKHKKWIVLAISCISAGLVVLVIILAAFMLYLRRSPKKSEDRPSTWLPVPTHLSNFDSKVSICSFASTTAQSHHLGRILSFSEIRDATKNFDESLVLGVGGFGKVYKGVLDNGVMVAVKRGNPGSRQGITEFRTEILMLSRLRHRHLVSLIGYCEEQNEMILVYEYMAGGPLRKHLYGSSLPTLSWKQRLEICIGSAKGLHYLHTGAADIIIHRDVKTTNILLDENLTAKVSDFGLSKLGPSLDQTHVSTAVKGSFGYLDPEYYRRQQLTEKSDVYSFGVVLMEVICARPAINPTLPRDQVNIAEWAMQWQKKGLLERVIDPHLLGSINLESLRKCGETAEKCLAEYGTERPTMGDVLWNLEYALQLQVSSGQNISSENSANYFPDISGWIPGETITDQESDATATSSGVFSQLMDPKGR